MVPKPTPGEWRFTLDFVRLNDCTSDVLEEETKKSERLVRDRSKAIKNLAEAESGARRQGADFSNRDGTITTLTDKLDKVTRDSIKKSTTISELQRDVDKKAAKHQLRGHCRIKSHS